jgi:hypothetical protein
LDPNETFHAAELQTRLDAFIKDGHRVLVYVVGYYEVTVTTNSSSIPSITRRLLIPISYTTFQYITIQYLYIFYDLFQLNYNVADILADYDAPTNFTNQFEGPLPYFIRCGQYIELIPVFSRTVGLVVPLVSFNQPVCYRVRLVSLSIPNQPIVGFSTLPSFFPYFLIEVQNTSGLATNSQSIYSNNPYTQKITFVASIANPRNQEISNYVVVYSFQTSILKFLPTDHLRIRIALPNGETLAYIFDQENVALVQSVNFKDLSYLRHLYSSYNLKNVTLKLSFHMVHT